MIQHANQYGNHSLQVTRSELDTDNLVLSDLGAKPTLAVEAELEALLVTGSTVNVGALKQADVHPPGVQLQLASPAHGAQQDTLVMSNLGYYQLKAQPGMSVLCTALAGFCAMAPVTSQAEGVIMWMCLLSVPLILRAVLPYPIPNCYQNVICFQACGVVSLACDFSSLCLEVPEAQAVLRSH